MTLAELIPLAVKVSIFLIALGLALSARLEDVLYLFRRPAQLLRSVLAMNIVMPLFMLLLALLVDFPRPVEIALIALAVSPVPPILPKKQMKAGGSASYATGLLFAMGLLAIIFVPLVVSLIGATVAAQPLQMSAGQTALIVLESILAPLALGLVVRHLAPALAARIAAPVSMIATLLLLLAGLAILAAAWPAIIALIGNGTIIAIAAFVLVGLAVGHWLGGPDPNDRTVLALSTATRHPGVALAITAANFPNEKAVIAAVLLYLIAGGIVALPYVNWRKRRQSDGGGAAIAS